MNSTRSERRRRTRNRRLIIAAIVAAVGVGVAAWLWQQNRIDPDALMARAEQQLAAGELSAAAIDLKNVVRLRPQDRGAREMLATVYLEGGNPASALKEFAKARELGATTEAVNLGYTRALLLSGKFDEAATEIAINGSNTHDWGVLRGLLDLAQQRVADAKQAFVAILEADPEHNEARRGLMQAELAAGNSAGARSEIETLLSASPQDAGLWLIRGDLDRFEGEMEAAESAFARAIELAPKNPLAHIGMAGTLIELGRYDEASNQLDLVGAQAESDPRVNFLRARIAEAKNEPLNALTDLRKVLQVAPMHRESLVMAARIHFRRSEFSRAQDYVGRILELEPNNAAAQRMMGAIQLASGRTDGVGQLIEQQDAAGSIEDPGMLALLGTAYLRHGKVAESQSSLEKAAELAPDSLPIRTQLAMSHLSGGESEVAIEQLNEIIEDEPEYVHAYVVLASAHLSAGDNVTATETAKKLLDNNPRSAVAHNVYGYMLEASDELDAAKTAYLAALEHDNRFHPARINLARLAIRDNDDATGKKYFDDILEIEPFNTFGLMGQAGLALKADDVDEAERLWLLAREHNEDAVAPRLLLAQHYSAKQNPTMAKTVIQEAYRLAPYATVVQSEYAKIMLEAGEFEPALSAATALVARAPNNVKGLELLARVQNQLGDADGLTATLEQISKQAPESINARVLLARLAIRRQDFDTAEQIAAAMLTTEHAAAGHELMGDMQLSKGQTAAAKDAYLKAFEASPSSTTVLKLDRVERTLGEQKQRLKQWLSDHPDDVQVRLVQATYLHQLGTGSDAIKEYETLYAADQENPVVLNNLAWLYHEKDDPRALELSQKAHELAPRSAEIMDTYGWILWHNNKHEQALGMLKKAAETAPQNPDISYHLAYARAAGGDKDGARRLLEQALSEHAEFQLRADAETLLSELQSPEE